VKRVSIRGQSNPNRSLLTINESIIISDKAREQLSAKAGLVGLGLKVRQLGILEPIEEEIKIRQKTVKYTPYEKLMDALIAILSGAKGQVEVNKRVRSDPALQAALVGVDVQNNQSCKIRWMPAQEITFSKCRRPWTIFCAHRAGSISMTTAKTG
jgi:hypothetical protein